MIAFAMLLIAGGCVKSWSVNFVTVPDLDDWVLYSTYELAPEGLIIETNNYVTAPFVLNGDFTITVKFKVATDITQRVYGAIWIGSTTGYPTGGSIISFYYQRGGVDLPYYQLWTDGPSTDLLEIATSSTEIPGMLNDEVNTYVLKKVSDHFVVTLNGTLIGEWDNITYQSDDFYLTLNSGSLTTDQIIYKSVKVSYEDGGLIPLDSSVLSKGAAGGFDGAATP
jgi:hypothetical protein